MKDDIVADLIHLGWSKLGSAKYYPGKDKDPDAVYISKDGVTYAILIYTMKGGRNEQAGTSEDNRPCNPLGI